MQRNMLFKLPAELRNLIYQHIVVDEEPIDLLRLKWMKDMTGYEVSLIPEPALARTCKAIRMEVLSLYYSENAFSFGTGTHALNMNKITETLSRWLTRLGSNARFLRSIDLDVNCEILGPRNAAYSLRDFWEILHMSIQSNGLALDIELVGDPLAGELCICAAKREAESRSISRHAPLFDMLTAASRLYFTTTEYGECDECQRPRLTEARKVNGSIYISDVE